MKKKIFAKRKILIATKHLKETVIAPILESKVGVQCFTSTLFDTDTLGTFTGDIIRVDDALTTLRKKCELGHQATNCDLVIASEGSFGMHPSLFFATANEELVMIKDFKNDLEIVAKEISLNTNFDQKTIASESELLEFIKKVDFPTHGIILKSEDKNPLKIYKEIYSEETLLEKYRKLKEQFSIVFIETDMRAQYNPTRMKVIEKATQNLVRKIKNICPSCKTPGFDIKIINPGLPCQSCSLPTRSSLSHLYECKKCSFKEEKMFPRDVQFEDPTYCDFCNP